MAYKYNHIFSFKKEQSDDVNLRVFRPKEVSV